jgi:glycosyltransferase involved in cell wall biosynthesis
MVIKFDNKPKDKPKVTLIIPTLNEAENLTALLPQVTKVPGLDEILLVDGHSKDNTVEIAKKLCPDIRVIFQDGKGKGNALRYGIDQATGEIVVTIDADGSMDPGEIPSFVNPLLEGYDFVKGSRFIHGVGTKDMPFSRIFGNRVFTVLVNVLYGTKFTDLCYGYNAFWKTVFQKNKLTYDGFEIETEMYIRALKGKAKIKEVPSFEHARLHGDGGLRTFKDGWRILRTIFRERFHG